VLVLALGTRLKIVRQQLNLQPGHAWSMMLVNQATAKGLVVQASARYNDKADPKTADLPLDSDVAHGVMRAFATQFLPEVQDAANQWSKKTLVDIVNELTKSLKDGVTDYTMGLYTEDGGHAVLPFAVDFSKRHYGGHSCL
jgi:hypothetical protein